MTDRIIELVKDALNIPYIDENNAIMDGSFTVSPYITDSLVGDGNPVNITVYSTIDLFYLSKTDAVNNGILLFKTLCEENGICCENPDFTYENDGKIWRSSVRVQEVLKNE